MENKGLMAVKVFVLIIVQVLILNNLNMFGFLNPYVYVLYVFFLPIERYNTMHLVYAFMIGIIIDAFSDSGGIHALSLLIITYLSPYFAVFTFGSNYMHRDSYNFSSQGILYLGLIILVHHLLMFSFEVFTFSRFLLILKMTFFTSLATFLFSMAIIPVLRAKK